MTLTQPVSLTPYNIRGEARASNHLTYWDIDLRFGRFLKRGCGSEYGVYAGFRYVNICDTTDVLIGGVGDFPASDTDDPANPSALAGTITLLQHEKRDFSGAGPMIGVGGRLDLWCNFYARAESSLLALIGNQKGFVTSQFGEIDGGVTRQFDERQRYCLASCRTVSPGFDMQLALGYEYQWCKIDADIELGYYLNHYWHVLASQGATVTGTIQNVTNGRRDIGFGGPFLRLKVSY